MSSSIKIAAALNALSALAHGAMGFQDVFPVLDKYPPSPMRTAAKIGWMEGCGYYTISSLILYKVAESGAGKYERLMLLVMFIQDFLAGFAFIRSGQHKPLLPCWGTPALLALGYTQGAS